MSSAAIRDAEAEQLERDAYRLLEYTHAAAKDDTPLVLRGGDLAAELRMEPAYTHRVLRFLSREGMLDYEESGPSIRITLPGVAYVQHLAWRRRSVRRRWS